MQRCCFQILVELTATHRPDDRRIRVTSEVSMLLHLNAEDKVSQLKTTMERQKRFQQLCRNFSFLSFLCLALLPFHIDSTRLVFH